MFIEMLTVTIYFVIGIALVSYWYNHEYAKDYEKMIEEDPHEKGVGDTFLLFICAFWPIKLVKNLIKTKKL